MGVIGPPVKMEILRWEMLMRTNIISQKYITSLRKLNTMREDWWNEEIKCKYCVVYEKSCFVLSQPSLVTRQFSTEGRVEFEFCSKQSPCFLTTSAECMILFVSSNTTRTPIFNKRKWVQKRNVKSHGIHHLTEKKKLKTYPRSQNTSSPDIYRCIMAHRAL